jgi:hypothetical protein
MPSSHAHGRLLPALLASVFLALPATALADEKHAEHWRLFVSDQAESKVTAIDLETGKVFPPFALSGYASRLALSESGRTVFAVQSDADMVNVIATGINLADHGEHADIEIADPKLLAEAFPGKRPVHAVMHDGKVALFFDDEGEARVIAESALLKGDTKTVAVKSPAPHHGVAVPAGSYTLISEPDLAATVEAGKQPPRLGLKVLDEAGSQVGDIAPCKGLHGEATSGRFVAFGCEEGVLVARTGGAKPPELTMLAYGADLPEGRVGTLLGGTAMQVFLGNYGDDKVVIVDPESETPYRLVELPVRRVDFILDPANVKYAYILTEDGKLNVLDMLSAEIVRSVGVTEPYSKDGHWRDPRPRLAIAGDTIAVTDPNKSLVRLLDRETLEEARTIAVPGLPFNIVAAGGSGVTH